MSEGSTNTATINVPALACAAIREFLGKALIKLPPEMDAAETVYQTLDDVLEYLGRSAADGGDRTITISVQHIDAGEASINVTSVLHLPPQGDVAVCHPGHGRTATVEPSHRCWSPRIAPGVIPII